MRQVPEQRSQYSPVTLTLKNGDTETVFSYSAGTPFPLPSLPEQGFVGWLTPSGALLPAGATVRPMENEAYEAIVLDSRQLEGAALIPAEGGARLRFLAVVDAASYNRLLAIAPALSICATVEAKGETLLTEVPLRDQIIAFGKNWYTTVADTALITKEDAAVAHTAAFYLNVTYSNGATRVIPVNATEENSRTLLFVASAALADTEAEYSPTLSETLRDLIS